MPRNDEDSVNIVKRKSNIVEKIGRSRVDDPQLPDDTRVFGPHPLALTQVRLNGRPKRI